MTAIPEPRTLIDELLEEQQQLTAVERFARAHERGQAPAQERYYRALLPTAAPGDGEQYAFGVDLDACTGCKACVSACHSLNGLDEDEIWRNVGVIHGGTSTAPYQQTITTACHHCVEPACLEGCPVKAYEKDAATGIVRHLDDQCIGCQYCVLKCPYDVPKYSAKRGIVRKCDLCSSRLAVGEAPACVQACPTGAISIRVVSKSAVSRSPDERLVPGAFRSDYAHPTTRYQTRRGMPSNARAGDDAALRFEHAHWPLIWMLVLTQAAAGMFGVVALLGRSTPSMPALSVAAFVLLQLGLGISVLHLGRPLGAWRAFLGLRTSWMSREIFAFGAFAGAAAGVVASPWLPAWIAGALAPVTAALGAGAVYCSAKIYVDTQRTFWAGALVFPKFFGTTVLLGAAGCAVVLGWSGESAIARTLMVAALGTHTALISWEIARFRHGLADAAAPDHRSIITMWKLGRSLVLARLALFAGAAAAAVMAIASVGPTAAVYATVSLSLTAASQIIERYFFFTAVIAPRMPGGVVS